MRNPYRSPADREMIRAAVRTLYAACPVPVEARFLDTGEFGATHVLAAGPEDAPPLVLIHGSTTNSAVWFGYMAEWAGVFRLFALDIPGEPGLSDERRPPLSGGYFARWLKVSIQALGIEKVHVCGMSLGGWIALDFGIRYPEAVRSMGLITAGGLTPFRRSFLPRVFIHLLRGMRGVRSINRIIHGPVPVDPRLDWFITLVARRFRPIQGNVPMFTDAELRGIGFPLVYFGGTADPLLDSESCARRLSGCVAHAGVHLLEGVAHVILDRGAELAGFFSRY